MGDFFENEDYFQAIVDYDEDSINVMYNMKMAEERIFYVDKDIDKSILLLQKQIIKINLDDSKNGIPKEKRKPIKILIDTYGGYLSEAMSLATTFKQSVTPIWTINIANAMSGGAILLISGHKRFALPYSKAMIHTGSNEYSGTYEQVMEQAAKYKNDVDEMCDYILENTAIELNTYNANKAKDWYLSDEEQLNYGLVDEIVDNLFALLEV